MNIREIKEENEIKFLSPYATKARFSMGRLRAQPPCEIRTCFERDRDRIIHSKAFRRLMHKTQVFFSPEGDHYRTRLTHTLEVAQIARSLAKALDLNETLTEAIALGHDLGHTPFGHLGESTLNKICPFAFEHNVQSLRVVDVLEEGDGLNLTYEVRDGIKNHCSGYKPNTLEGALVYLSDKIAYINHDIDDAMRGKVLTFEDLPKDILEVLGTTSTQRINTLIIDVVENSKGKDEIKMSPLINDAMFDLRKFLFQHVYVGSSAKKEEEKASYIIEQLYGYYVMHPEKMPEDYVMRSKSDGIERSVCDYIAGMTDNYAIRMFEELFIPKSWPM